MFDSFSPIFGEKEHNGALKISIEGKVVFTTFSFPCTTLECEGTIWGFNVPCALESSIGQVHFLVFINPIYPSIKCRRCGIDSMDLNVLNEILKDEVMYYLWEHQKEANFIPYPIDRT